eukprot:TRINITY_DN596_c0_g1_i1.p1 TRINITY_DN596_c0_g1~~TRINITY_DN596_c0_g1_i1.p1  ORF type:complete len:185 (-),score=16.58 TRINITY_DN596_c0_g1_i1:155-709(-)
MTQLALLFLTLFCALTIFASQQEALNSICTDRLDIPCELLGDVKDALSDDFLERFGSVISSETNSTRTWDDVLFTLASLIYEQTQQFEDLDIWFLGPESEVFIASNKMIVYNDTIEWCLSKELFACIPPICCQTVILQSYFCNDEGWDIVEKDQSWYAKYTRRIVGPGYISYVLLASKPVDLSY